MENSAYAFSNIYDMLFMELFINKNLIDFQIKEKETLSNILESVEKWASDGKKYIIDYKVTCKSPHSVVNYELENEDIKKLEIQIGNKGALIAKSTEEFYRYLERTCNYLLQKYNNNDINFHYSELIDNFQSIQQTFLSLSYFFQKSKNDVLQQNDILNELNTILQQKEEYFQKKENIFYLINYFNTMKYHTNIWHQISVYNDITKEEAKAFLKEYMSYYSILEDKIETIAIDFSSGKEKSAIIELYRTLEIITNNVLLLSILERGKEIQEKVLSTFGEILDCIGNSDILTVADIVDYDLREIVEKLKIMELS